jgi:type I restriction enzyme S subunit
MASAGQTRSYDRAESVVFLKTNERFGGLSNMAPGFPLRVNGVRILTSEALYQACRFPHMPDVQRLIITEHSPMTAKMRGKPFRSESRPDWDSVRVKIMRWCLRVKLAQNWGAFSKLLLETGDKPIVEQSSKDDFWGAKVADDGKLVGMNVLGRLLMELREEIKVGNRERLSSVRPLAISDFLLYGLPIETIAVGSEPAIAGTALGKPTPRRPSAIAPSVSTQKSLFEPIERPGRAHADVHPDVGRSGPLSNTERRQDPMIDGLRPYAEMRPTGLPWLGDVPSHWEVRRAKRMLKPMEIPIRPEDDIVTCFRDGQVTLRKNRRSSGFMIALLEQGYQGVRAGQLVVHSMDAFAGAIGISDSDGKCTPEYIVCDPREPETLLTYYAWLLRYVARTQYILAAYPAVRERAPRLRYPDLGELKLPAPPLEEQRLIVRFLDWHGALTTKLIRAKQNALKLVAEQRNVLTHDVVSASGTQQMRLDVVTDLVLRPVIRESAEIYTPIGMFNRGRGIFRKTPTRGDELGDSTFSWVKDGDLVLSGQFAWEGAVALAGSGEDGCVASHRYHVLRGKEGVLQTTYLGSFLRTSFGQLLLDEHSRGAAGRNRPLNIRTLRKEKIPVPPQAKQARLIEIVTLEGQLASSIARFSQHLQGFRTRLIADVVTGKLDVRAAAASLPEIKEEEPIDDDLDEIIDDAETEEVAA